MLIIIHRVNSIEKLKDVPKEYGVEIDVRAEGKTLILNHDPFHGGETLEEYLKHFNHKFILFHLKETGIEDKIIDLAKKFNIDDYFFLDMENPLVYKATMERGFKKIAVRYSEAEPIEFALAHKGLVGWVFIDTQTILPLDKYLYNRLKDAGFKLCLVCPNLFGRRDDINKYREFMKENNIYMDAIMTELEDIDEWKRD